MSDEHAWVRERLSGLSRPAMPEDVAARMDAAIAAESAAAAGPTIPAQATAADRRAAPRRRNRALVALTGVAAAFILFAAVGPIGTTTGDSDDAFDIAAAPEETTTADGTAESLAEPAPGSPGAAAADLDQVSRVMTATDTPYSRTELAAQVGDVAASPPAAAPERGAAPDGGAAGDDPGAETPASEDPAAEDQTTGAAGSDDAAAPEGTPMGAAEDGSGPAWAADEAWPAASLAGAGACVAGLPEGIADLVLVDQAQFEGQPALVSARSTDQGLLEVTVQKATCTADDPAVLYRTTIVP